MPKEEDDALRDRIALMMKAEDYVPQVAPFPETNVEFDAIMDVIRDLPKDDLLGRLVIGGFIPTPVEEQSCENCMYYLVHRKWCDLPGLDVPVEPEWWCRLWRI